MVGLFYLNSREALVRAVLDDCIITHTDPRAKAASAAVAYLVARLVQSAENSSPGDQVLEIADCVDIIDTDMSAMLRWVTQITALPEDEALFEIGTSSDSLEVVPAATWCFLKYPRDFTRAVLAAVNGGDAADSIAALTGSFVGAFAGLDAIPHTWKSGVENGDVLIAIGEHLAGIAITKRENSASA